MYMVCQSHLVAADAVVAGGGLLADDDAVLLLGGVAELRGGEGDRFHGVDRETSAI